MVGRFIELCNRVIMELVWALSHVAFHVWAAEEDKEVTVCMFFYAKDGNRLGSEK